MHGSFGLARGNVPFRAGSTSKPPFDMSLVMGGLCHMSGGRTSKLRKHLPGSLYSVRSHGSGLETVVSVMEIFS